MVKVLLLSLTILFALPNFIEKSIEEKEVYNQKEKFSPSLATINSVDKLERYTDNLAIQRNISTYSVDYCILLENILSQRFYHGFSRYSVKDNWIAALSEKISGRGLSCLVEADEILKNEHAACSQQAIVMMEILRRKKIDYRDVGFPHHYAMEAKINGSWYYFDANMEVSTTPSSRNHQNWNGKGDILKQFYDPAIHTDLDYQFGVNKHAKFGVVNANPAPRLKIFQFITSILSKFLWAFPLLILYSRRNDMKSHQFPYMEQRDLRPLFG